MISDFKEFNEDLILESLNESILYFSPKNDRVFRRL